ARPRERECATQTGGASADDDHVICNCHVVVHRDQHAVLQCKWQGFLPEWQYLVMANDLDRVLTAVGPRLRALRQRREMTLADLSAATDISVSTLSRLESGQRRPNLELLLPLAQAHGVPLDELIGPSATGDPRIHAEPTTRNGMTVLPLTRRSGGLQAYKLIIPARRGLHEPNL